MPQSLILNSQYSRRWLESVWNKHTFLTWKKHLIMRGFHTVLTIKKRHVFFFRQRGRWRGFLYWVSSVISLIRACHCSCLWMRWFWIMLWTCQWTCWERVIVVVGLKVSPTLQWVQMSFFLWVWLVFRVFPFFRFGSVDWVRAMSFQLRWFRVPLLTQLKM